MPSVTLECSGYIAGDCLRPGQRRWLFRIRWRRLSPRLVKFNRRITCELFDFLANPGERVPGKGLVFVFAWPGCHYGLPFARCKQLDFPAVVRGFATVPGP